MKRAVTLFLSGFKYLLSLYMMLAGILTIISEPYEKSNLGIVYETKPTLILLGVIIFFSGLTLLIGKIKKWRKIQGYGLFAIYNCFLFAFILNWVGLGWSFAWGNLIGAAVVGGLYLRWKYHIFYYEKVDKTAPVV